jgi:lipoprotein NlpD
MIRSAGDSAQPPLVSGARLGIGALLCALVVACGTSPKAPPKESSHAGAASVPSPSDAAAAGAPAAKPRSQRDAQARKDKPRSAKAGKPAAPPVAASTSPGSAAGTFMWPASGSVAGRFNGGTSKGIDIHGNPGDPVVAAAGGRVVYAGSRLRGYGNLVIIKHDKLLMTAYAHNRRILVRENEQVQAGQKIAEMGSTDSNTTRLHFELRRDGVAVDPMPYLKSAGPAP